MGPILHADQQAVPHFLAAMVASAEDAIVGLTSDLLVACWNAGAEKIFSFRAEEIVGLPVFVLLPADQKSDWAERFEQTAQGKHLKRLDTVWRAKDGRSVPVSVTLSPILDATQAIVGLSILARDITERQEMEQSRQTAIREWQTTFDAVGAAMWLLDKNQRVLRCNRAAERLLNKKPSQILGRPCWELVHRTLEPILECPLVRVRKSLQHESMKMVIGVNWYEVSVDPILDETGQYCGSIHILTDITPRKKAEVELHQLYEQMRFDAEMKTELLQEINHRVKNNLISILGLIQTEQRFLPNEEYRPGVKEALDHLSQRIHGLIDVHQLLSETQWKPMHLSELASRIITTVANSLGLGKQVTIEIDPSPVLISPRQANSLALALNELATNTLKHAAQGRKMTRIAVQIQLEGDSILLVYRDDGPGFPPEILDRSRSGVGLSLMRQLASGAFRGTLTLANDGGAVTALRIKSDKVNRT